MYVPEGREAHLADFAQVRVGKVNIFPGKRIAGTYPYTSAICISISAVLSLAIAVIHFRMPCWEAETKDPEWFY